MSCFAESLPTRPLQKTKTSRAKICPGSEFIRGIPDKCNSPYSRELGLEMLEYASRLTRSIARGYRRLQRATPVLEAIRQNPDLGRIYAGFYHQLPLGLATDPIRSIPRLFLRQSRYHHQAQHPGRFYFPDLEAKPWWPSDANSKMLVTNTDIITKEFNDIRSRTKTEESDMHLVSAGNWLSFYLFN